MIKYRNENSSMKSVSMVTFHHYFTRVSDEITQETSKVTFSLQRKSVLLLPDVFSNSSRCNCWNYTFNKNKSSAAFLLWGFKCMFQSAGLSGGFSPSDRNSRFGSGTFHILGFSSTINGKREHLTVKEGSGQHLDRIHTEVSLCSASLRLDQLLFILPLPHSHCLPGLWTNITNPFITLTIWTCISRHKLYLLNIIFHFCFSKNGNSWWCVIVFASVLFLFCFVLSLFPVFFTQLGFFSCRLWALACHVTLLSRQRGVIHPVSKRSQHSHLSACKLELFVPL